jgi:hypothetical protein
MKLFRFIVFLSTLGVSCDSRSSCGVPLNLVIIELFTLLLNFVPGTLVLFEEKREGDLRRRWGLERVEGVMLLVK